MSKAWIARRSSAGVALLVCVPLAAVLLPAPSSAHAALRAPTLNWARCSDPSHETLQCATARVPLNYRRPSRSKTRLAVFRHRATDPARRIGTLFFNPGGPGGSASTVLAPIVPYFPAAVRARFDIVSWDPRGIAESRGVQCFASQKREDRFLAGVGGAGEAFPVGDTAKHRWIRRYQRFAQRCRRRNGEFLRHISTADSARDLNQLRRAVGDARLNYIGVSYGTFLGATYANLFPRGLRTMVLDGNVDPAAWVGRQRKANAGRFLGTALRLRSDEGSAKTVRAFLDLCGRAEPARCAFSAGSASATRAKFATLLQALRQFRSGAAYGKLVAKTLPGLYRVEKWPALAKVLQDLWATGRTSRKIPRPTVPPPGATSARGNERSYAGPEQFLAVICSESPNPRPARFLTLDRFAYDRSGAVGPYWSWVTEPCGSWRVRAASRYTGPWDRRTANPVLVIGNTHDPATPYTGAQAMARALSRARLLTVDGYGHTALENTGACANGYMSQYFIDKTLPPRGARCRGQQPFTEDG